MTITVATARPNAGRFGSPTRTIMDYAAWTGPARRPHQVRALTELTSAYQRAGRAQIHWACGTGKTLVGRWLAEDARSDTTLVLLPSLALVAQTLQEWQNASPWPFGAIVVCSDPTAADGWRVERGWWADRGVEVTTDSRIVSQFLRGDSVVPRVVFSTYHSAGIVAEAIRRVRGRFDLMVCDEAHRLAGEPDPRFRVALDDGLLPATRRLFTTATPIYSAGALSMNDKAMFGPVADRVDFGQAIDAGLLVDYQVLVLDASGDAEKLESGQQVPAALAAAAREGLTRVISFHSRVAGARRFAAAVDGLQLPDGRTVRAMAIAGSDSTARRREILDELAAGRPDTLTLVTNARCLTEGVNVPAVDGVIFADPKDSDTDIVQGVGRALRTAPGKKRGLIILPVVVPPGADDEQLSSGPFAAVWGVLRALRSLDPRMAVELDRARNWQNPHTGERTGDGHRASRLLNFDVAGVDLAAFAARVVDDTGADETWDETLEMLRGWAVEHGHAAISWNTNVQGRPVGRWVNTQRRAYAAGALPAHRVAALSRILGWSWTYDGAWWNADYVAVAAAAVDGLDLNDPAVSSTRLTSRIGGMSSTVGRWCAQQRRAWRDGDLDERQTQMCEQLPGWTWDAGVPERDLRMVDALAEWVDVHHDANVPADEMWGSKPLGSFIAAVRRRAVMGQLLVPLADDIAVVTPARPHPGVLDWRARDARWEANLLALHQFVQRTGGCDIPDQHVEVFRGWNSNLYAWATRQRHLRRHGELEREREVLLEKVTGWAWERERKTRVLVGIGDRQHGTRNGYAAGCTCDPCTNANAAYEAERQRRRAAGEATTDLVDTAEARAHLRILEARMATKRARPTMQQLTCFNKKTIDEVINGERKRITPEVHAALMALTVERLRAHIAANPSTRDELPAGPTLALIDDLVRRRWPKAWISREIGGDGRALQIGKTGSGLIRRETVDAIAALHKAVGDRTPPVVPRGTVLPTLAEIIAAEQETTPSS